jgi:tetratricopeptide (TPR) repeat protein
MSHLEQEALQRILGGEGGPIEAEDAAEHLLACDRCRAAAGTLIEVLRAENHPELSKSGTLQVVFDLIDRERQSGVDSLTAMAEWAEVRRLPSRRSQRDRVRMAKACHTTAFLKLVLGELQEARGWEEAEFLASLAFLSIEAMHQRHKTTLHASHDLQAEVWTAVANARRLAAEWRRAHQALDNAERHLKEGTGDRRLKAGLLSITASTLVDEGHIPQALNTLEECQAIYEGLSEWGLVARTLIQVANLWEPIEPEKGLMALERAAPLIPAEDSYLRLLAELLRVECLIGAGKPSEALRVFRRASQLLASSPRLRPRIRGRFTTARLLDALGYRQEAERIFDEVVDQDIEHELYKDAYLDLLYLYGHHMKAGDPDKAARVCRRALSDPALATVAHEQLQALWTLLLEAVALHPISQDLLSRLRQYVNVHWKHPAATPPWVNSR